MWYNPVPPIDRKSWRLKIGGLVERPVAVSLEELRKLPHENQSSRMKCVQCWSARAEWGGFRFGALLDMVKPKSAAKDGPHRLRGQVVRVFSNPRSTLATRAAGARHGRRAPCG